jgi:3-deoxy-manno-octulosonate cytidylyltransferase (CMP-KDO synthetase)
MKTLGIIPARYASSRLPGKPLLDIGGKSMIRRVYERVAQASRIDEVVVATDDRRIYEHVRAFGGRAEMTGPDHRSGTDRCAEVAAARPDADLVVNVQGDEPFIDPAQIDKVLEPLAGGQRALSTLACPLEQEEDWFQPQVVKVVINQRGEAMYFSRSPIPYVRDAEPGQWSTRVTGYRHLGLYGFTRASLLAVAALAPSAYEQAEGLEQLRWLEAGYVIGVAITDRHYRGVDTPDDLALARHWAETRE